ncbi:hypothetical protein F5Y16DRAFT_367323 [Xylariaceae sp. FL0255]|nr:hypothetical protein F5Y16DRAFT_367323 [Xylariaceae sp. FL0255]
MIQAPTAHLSYPRISTPPSRSKRRGELRYPRSPRYPDTELGVLACNTHRSVLTIHIDAGPPFTQRPFLLLLFFLLLPYLSLPNLRYLSPSLFLPLTTIVGLYLHFTFRWSTFHTVVFLGSSSVVTLLNKQIQYRQIHTSPTA